MIRVENLTKRFTGAVALRGISFTVDRGEVLGFLGPNGAGKTTAMRILASYLAPTSGRAQIDGKDVVRDSLAVRRAVGYLPESVPLYPEMRVVEYLSYRARLKGVPRRGFRGHVDSAIGRCGLGDVRRRILGQLSKGYRQRVGLADAILGSPRVLLLDEPTIGLDPNQIRQVRDLIRELGKEHTIVLSSHILPEVEQSCGRVLILSKGQIVAQDTTENLKGRLKGSLRVVVEAKGPPDYLREALSKLEAVLSLRCEIEDHFNRFSLEVSRDIREDIYRLGVEKGWLLRELKLEKASLEDIFVDITTREGA